MNSKFILSLITSLLLLGASAQAGTKEEIMRVQADVLALQNQVRELEKSFTEKTDGLRSLVVQLNDQVAESNIILDRLSKTLEAQASGGRSADQALLEEIRRLSGKMDDAATRISALAQQISDLKVQAAPISPAAAGGSITSVYDQAYLDYIQGNFDMAIKGFAAYLSSDPGGANAPAAHLYVGDSYSNLGKLEDAVAAFTRVINEYPEAIQAPSALFKRGRAELALQESDNAIADFKAVIQKYPDSAEAERAKDELRRMGVSPDRPASKPKSRKTR